MDKHIEEHLAATRESSHYGFSLGMVDPDDIAPGVVRREIPSDEAITRRIFEPCAPSIPGLHELQAFTMPERQSFRPVDPRSITAPGRSLTRRILITASVVAGIALGAVGGWLHGRKSMTNVVAFRAVTPSAVSPERPKDLPQSKPSIAPVFEITPLPDTIRIEIRVDPTNAVLTLDKHPVVGNRLQAEVPKDQLIHVVGASAAGFVSFNQIVSFSNDVNLDIKLRRERSALRTSARPHYPKVEARAEADSRPQIQPSHVEEPGMKMERPSVRRPSNQIDERDPYAP